MVQHLQAPFALRPRCGLLLMVASLVVASTLGCGHRRASMRPVYMAPTAVPATVIPSTPTTLEPTIVEPPGSTSSLGESGLAPIDAPVAPAASSPPRPDEPPLDPPARIPSAEPGKGASISPSGSSLNANGQRTSSGRLRQARLREEIRPYVSDPDDLFMPPKADRPWKYVVLHHSANPAGNYDQIDGEHRKVLGFDGCGYHFIIGNGTGSPDGRIEVAQRWINQKNGVHCRNGKTSEMNEYGIGICLVGDLDDTPPTPRQIAAAKALVAYLGDRYGIKADHLGTHAHLASTPTACPGKMFPAQAILGSRNLARNEDLEHGESTR